MILVTVGNATQEFRRLLETVERLAREGFFGRETLLVQNGHSRAITLPHGRCQAFMAPEEFQRSLQEASLLIAHAGWGTLVQAMRAGKVPVVMPRRKRYGEIINDHQLEVVEALAKQGCLLPAYEPVDLTWSLQEARRSHGRWVLPASPMRGLVREVLEQMLERRAA